MRGGRGGGEGGQGEKGGEVARGGGKGGTGGRGVGYRIGEARNSLSKVWEGEVSTEEEGNLLDVEKELGIYKLVWGVKKGGFPLR